MEVGDTAHGQGVSLLQYREFAIPHRASRRGVW
jgi:hypothetical protein